jgi:UDPglucose 6-dehydrogenase
MNVTIFGTGYVGLVTGTCLADVGCNVVCVDTDVTKIEGLQQGIIPIYEPGLETLVRANIARQRLRFTVDVAEGITHADVIFIAVGTPTTDSGAADLTYVKSVATAIGGHLNQPTTIVIKSTVPVGTSDQVRQIIQFELDSRGVEVPFYMASVPEFLKEGSAIEDCLRPSRIVIGADHSDTAQLLRRLYAPFNRNHDRIVTMSIRSAELTKYAANAMLAAKISLMNEIAVIAEQVGADVEQVRQGIGSDPRIGWSFIYPGAGYGGSCFPKDVRALSHLAREHRVNPLILDSVETRNFYQKQHLFSLLLRHYGSRDALLSKTIAVWGLAFKPDTDDIRDAPSLTLLDQLYTAGCQVQVYDPVATENVQRLLNGRDRLRFVTTATDALQNANALVICTEWKEFRSPDFVQLSGILRDRVIFDGRNMYDPDEVAAHGIAYYGIGRGRSVQRM